MFPKDWDDKAAILFLEEAARYFAKRDTGGEDSAYWANVYNSERCTRTVALIKELMNTRSQ